MTEALKQAAQQALDALKKKHGQWGQGHDELNVSAIDALERALTQRPAAQAGEREAFEAEMRCEETWGHRSLKKRPDGRYQNWQVDVMWDVWQARASLPTQPAAQADCVGCEGKPSATNSPCAVCMGAQQVTPEPVQLDVVRQAIEERDAMESRYHELAKSMTYKGNSVAWWHSKATAYRNAIDEVWGALKAAGIYADGAKTCADGVRELAATPEPVGEVVAWWYDTHPRPSIETIRLDHTFTDHAGEYLKGRPLVFGDTHAAPGVPDGFALVPVEPTAAMLHCIVYDQYPQDADEGRKLQRKQLGEPNSEDHVPFKTEFELAVGQYKRMLAAAQAKGADK